MLSDLAFLHARGVPRGHVPWGGTREGGRRVVQRSARPPLFAARRRAAGLPVLAAAAVGVVGVAVPGTLPLRGRVDPELLRRH